MDNAGVIANISRGALLISLIGLMVINVRSLSRLIYSLFISFVVAGGVLLLVSLLTPAILTNLVPAELDPVFGALKTDLLSDLINYTFELSRNRSYLYLLLAGTFYLIWRLAPLARLQAWVDPNIFPSPQRSAPSRKGRKNK